MKRNGLNKCVKFRKDACLEILMIKKILVPGENMLGHAMSYNRPNVTIFIALKDIVFRGFQYFCFKRYSFPWFSVFFALKDIVFRGFQYFLL